MTEQTCQYGPEPYTWTLKSEVNDMVRYACDQHLAGVMLHLMTNMPQQPVWVTKRDPFRKALNSDRFRPLAHQEAIKSHPGYWNEFRMGIDCICAPGDADTPIIRTKDGKHEHWAVHPVSAPERGPQDTFTSNPQAAAAFEQWRGDNFETDYQEERG